MTRIEIACGTNLAKLTSVSKFLVVGNALSCRSFQIIFVPLVENVGCIVVDVVVLVVVVGDTTWT